MNLTWAAGTQICRRPPADDVPRYRRLSSFFETRDANGKQLGRRTYAVPCSAVCTLVRAAICTAVNAAEPTAPRPTAGRINPGFARGALLPVSAPDRSPGNPAAAHMLSAGGSPRKCALKAAPHRGNTGDGAGGILAWRAVRAGGLSRVPSSARSHAAALRCRSAVDDRCAAGGPRSSPATEPPSRRYVQPRTAR